MIKTAFVFAIVGMLIALVWHFLVGDALRSLPFRLAFAGTSNACFGALLLRYRFIEPF